MKNKNQYKKKILKSPLEVVETLSGEISTQERRELCSLVEKQTELKKVIKLKVNERKLLSKEVGAVKSSGQSADALIDRVKSLSEEIKDIETKLIPIEDEIFSLIEDYQAKKDREATLKEKDHNLVDSGIQVSKKDLLNEAEKVSIELTKDFDSISKFIDNNNQSSIYHRPEWLDLIHNTFGHSTYLFAAFNSDKEIVGVLPLVRLKSKLFGDFMVSMPYFNYGGAISSNPLIEDKLMQAAVIQAKTLGVSHIEFRDEVAREAFPSRTDKVNMLLELDSSADKLWQKFPSKLRAQIRRSQKEALSSKIGGIELLDDFYRVFAVNMRDLGTPIYDYRFFKNILNAFTRNAKIVIVYHHSKPVSCAFLLSENYRMEIPWASTLKSANHLNANMFLYWQVLQFAISKECNIFDFGRSSKNAGTYKFKKQWGAKPKASIWHYWLNEGVEMPALNPNNPKFKLLVNCWKLLPVFITKLIGPLIVKNLP